MVGKVLGLNPNAVTLRKSSYQKVAAFFVALLLNNPLALKDHI